MSVEVGHVLGVWETFPEQASGWIQDSGFKPGSGSKAQVLFPLCPFFQPSPNRWRFHRPRWFNQGIPGISESQCQPGEAVSAQSPVLSRSQFPTLSLFFFFIKLKEPAWNAEDPGSVPGSGRSPGERDGYPLQYSCLENPMDRGAWWAIAVHRIAKSWTQLND